MKSQRRYLFLAAALTFALVLSLAGGREMGFAAGQHPGDPPATHNMLVVGENAVHLSHLPMFQQEGKPVMPHRYQVILEVAFTERGNDPQRTYAEDRRKHRETKIYTLSPERFVLPTLVSKDSQRKPFRSLKGTIFRGHLEKPGSIPILRDVIINVERVVHFREFDPNAEKPSQLEYLLFGNGKEFFLAHLITMAPDFDQVLAVNVTGRTFTDEELANGVQLFFPETTNTAASRLKENQQVSGEIKVGNASMSEKLRIEVVRELYFEEGELSIPPEFETTPAEEQAGFP